MVFSGCVPISCMYTATQTLVLSAPSDDQLNNDEDDPFTTANTEVLSLQPTQLS